jgi:hypothetical protein
LHPFRRAIDCFAALAMTKLHAECDKSTRRANHSKSCLSLCAKIFRSLRRANH